MGILPGSGPLGSGPTGPGSGFSVMPLCTAKDGLVQVVLKTKDNSSHSWIAG